MNVGCYKCQKFSNLFKNSAKLTKFYNNSINNRSTSILFFRSTSTEIREKTDLERRLGSIKFTLNDAGIDPILSIPYHSEEQLQQLVIDTLVLHGVERDLITLDSDLVNYIGLSRFDVLQLIETMESYLQYSMLDDDALECRTVRKISKVLHTILMFDKADQMHRGPYYYPSDLEELVTFCYQVDELSYVDYLKYLFSQKKK